MIRFPPDFREFLKLLADREVFYLLVGGYAVGFHGYPRATGDMDIWIERSAQNAAKVVAVLREFGFDSPQLQPTLFTESGKIVRMGVPPMRLELLTSIDGVEFSSCYAHRTVAEFDGLVVNVIDLANLRRNKQASGRPKDLADLDNLPTA